MNKVVLFKVRRLVKGINWPLLVFLLLFLNVKLVIKLLAIGFIYFVNPNFKFGFKLKNSRLPLFYIAAISIAVFDWLVFKNYVSFTYNAAFFTGLLFWLLCILALHQVKLAAEGTAVTTLHRTIALFFLINALVSICNIAVIMLEIHRLNPYTYQGNFQQYFLNTGDYIKGVTFDVSITNSVIAAFGVIYFLLRQKTVMLFLCMAVLLLAASNTVNIVLVGVMIMLFVWPSNKVQKSLMVVCLMMLITFMVKVSPQNMYYVDKMYNKIVFNRNVSFDPLPVKQVRITTIADSLLTPEQRQQKIAQLYLDTLSIKLAQTQAPNQQITAAPIKLEIPKDSIHTATFQSKADTNAAQVKLLAFITAHHKELVLSNQPQSDHVAIVPGKLTAFKQTVQFLIGHPQKALTGDGMGNFSSKLAFRTTNLGMAGGYPIKFIHIDPDFLHNHLDIYLNFFSKRSGMHSVTNSPDSVYDQLLAEYGLAGVLAFVIFYLGYFLKQYRYLSYGLPLLLLTCAVFFTDYWFEQLSVVVLLELMLFADIKENQSPKPVRV